jgi:hypothetical protein
VGQALGLRRPPRPPNGGETDPAWGGSVRELLSGTRLDSFMRRGGLEGRRRPRACPTDSENMARPKIPRSQEFRDSSRRLRSTRKIMPIGRDRCSLVAAPLLCGAGWHPARRLFTGATGERRGIGKLDRAFKESALRRGAGRDARSHRRSPPVDDVNRLRHGDKCRGANGSAWRKLLAKTTNTSERSHRLERFALSRTLFLQNTPKRTLYYPGNGLSRYPAGD